MDIEHKKYNIIYADPPWDYERTLKIQYATSSWGKLVKLPPLTQFVVGV